ncbi:Spore germination protein, putative [Babesia ovata]|uniref:Spore germination protein, putative n=1 Tax=Babesia ovata TaxID=189622 RepID=A0A2H6K734_9APIC|nr:Spore germination protein, putative [Babesia ovata]GBE58795.1 Spore germination protein, putative [Babesia ovata]
MFGDRQREVDDRLRVFLHQVNGAWLPVVEREKADDPLTVRSYIFDILNHIVLVLEHLEDEGEHVRCKGFHIPLFEAVQDSGDESVLQAHDKDNWYQEFSPLLERGGPECTHEHFQRHLNELLDIPMIQQVVFWAP